MYTPDKIKHAHSINNQLSTLKGLSPYIIRSIKKLLEPDEGQDPNLWETANLMGQYYNNYDLDDALVNSIKTIITDIRNLQGECAKQNKKPTTVVFGTSGWRGVIGEDFTCLNVHKVIHAIIDLLKTDTFLNVNNFADFSAVQQAGILILRDNRFMGDEFLEIARKELTSAGIKVYDAGECPTGVGSALLTELKAAGSVNFTPSHNPMEYAGIKFNPADGGPADTNLTSIIEQYANVYMQEDTHFEPAMSENKAFVEHVDGNKIFTAFIENKAQAFDIVKIREWLAANKKDICLVVDFMHGASRGYIENLLGDNLVNDLLKLGAIQFIHKDDDFSFHGVKPEPSAKNQRPLIELLEGSGKKFTLAVALDPDADRIRFADAHMDIDMNRFAAIAYKSLLLKGMKGGIVSSVPSSDFPLKIAEAEKQEVVETQVGFKNFREAFKSGKIILGFEESDGISFIGHTLEKCALAGFLAALDALALQNKNLSVQYLNLQKQYGYFYPDKAGADVKGVSVEEWQDYKKNVVRALQQGLFKEGDMLEIAGESKRIKRINILDGLKLILDDDSWILLRPSGTEPKFRYYYEVVSRDGELANPLTTLNDYKNAAEDILIKARALVDKSN